MTVVGTPPTAYVPDWVDRGAAVSSDFTVSSSRVARQAEQKVDALRLAPP
jgi:hypothetical protein